MAANFCDMFKHRSGKFCLLANAGLLAGHLNSSDWELAARHRPMPIGARKEIDKRGYALRSFANKGWGLAELLYQKSTYY